jgi:hypothetical protein
MPSKNTIAKREERARKRKAGFRPKEIWLHIKANMDNVKATVDYENNKAIASIMHSKADKEGLK